MTTARDLINDALVELGIYAAGEPLADVDLEQGLRILNRMMDSWSNESLTVYTTVEQSGALQVGKSSYTIGTSGGADFNLTRPLKILSSPVSAYVQDTNSNNYFMDVVERDQWNTLANRGPTTTSNFPDTLFYDQQFPLGVINVFPTPNIAYTAFWDSWLQLSSFANVSANINLPLGYEAAITHNLAVECQPFFTDDKLSEVVLTLAMTSKASIKRTNIKPVTAIYDSEIVSRSTQRYNIYTDGRSASTI